MFTVVLLPALPFWKLLYLSYSQKQTFYIFPHNRCPPVHCTLPAYEIVNISMFGINPWVNVINRQFMYFVIFRVINLHVSCIYCAVYHICICPIPLYCFLHLFVCANHHHWYEQSALTLKYCILLTVYVLYDSLNKQQSFA
jgi:predicted CDP-diglyceride synthetase/phosphatidate cytidylyltransferase